MSGPDKKSNNYRLIDGYQPKLETGQTFPVAVIDFEEITQQPWTRLGRNYDGARIKQTLKLAQSGACTR